MFIEPYLFIIREREIVSDKVGKNIKILHITDMHLKGKVSSKMVKFLKETNKINPDLIFITGDYSENDDGLKHLSGVLGLFSSNIPVVCVLGNHDFYNYGIIGFIKPHLIKPKKRKICKTLSELKANNLTVLRNEHKLLKTKGGFLCIYGIEYTDHIDKVPEFRVESLSERFFNVLLVHSPDYLFFLKKKDYKNIDLILVGHTHGGQVRVPLKGHILTRTKYSKKLADGFLILNKTYININRGLGQGLNFRFLCRPEVVLINIKSKP